MQIYFVAAFALLALLFALGKRSIILKQSPGTKKMQEIADLIHQGALAFLRKQYEFLSIFIGAAFIVIWLAIDSATAFAFVFGAILSALAGNIGMRTATRANVRTTAGCQKSLNAGFKIAFNSGTVVGMSNNYLWIWIGSEQHCFICEGGRRHLHQGCRCRR